MPPFSLIMTHGIFLLLLRRIARVRLLLRLRGLYRRLLLLILAFLLAFLLAATLALFLRMFACFRSFAFFIVWDSDDFSRRRFTFWWSFLVAMSRISCGTDPNTLWNGATFGIVATSIYPRR
jgi:hypothetical protein